MSQRKHITTIQHMRDHACEAVEIAVGRTRDDLDHDRVLNLALTRLVGIVGQAAQKLPTDFQERHQAVPWQHFTDSSLQLIQNYNSVDFDILWTIVQDDLPALIDQLEIILSKEN